MKLEQAVIMGRFCGLNSVDECIGNIYRHYTQLLPYDAIDKEISELEREIHLYEQNALTLDWDYINSEVQKLEDNFIAECEKVSKHEQTEEEKNFLTDIL